jgi:predicted enzyme related to lactoylglutathione lyase
MNDSNDSGAALVARVDFIGLPTHDLETAVAFYGETLGLRRSTYRPDRHHAEFETDNLTINVMDAEKMGLKHVVSANPIALHVDDVQAARAELEGKGVEFAMDTFDTGVCHMAFFADPDGNALMLHHRYAPKQPEG